MLNNFISGPNQEGIPCTVIIGEDVPEFCFNMKWVLCMKLTKHDAPNIAQHLNTLHLNRKQDALIFAQGEGTNMLVEQLSNLTVPLFRSPCPVFMPMEHADLIELRLDSGIVFYKSEDDTDYSLFDVFAVKGEPPFIQKIATWSKLDGFENHANKNRWDRRTDLNGTEIINTSDFYKNWAELIYDSDGNLIGSEGIVADRLNIIADRLNLTVATILPDGKENCGGRLLENGSWTACVGMLTRHKADVSANGLAWTLSRDTAIDYADLLQVPNGGYTLIGRRARAKVLDMWVYVGVFGLAQWLIFTGFLLSFVLFFFVVSSTSVEAEDTSVTTKAITSIHMVLLFVIQLGAHPEGGSLAKRFLYLTASTLTFLLFAYYTTEVTAQMTSTRPLANSIHTFEDVLKSEDVRVIVVKGTSWASHIGSSIPGTAKHEVYQTRIENDDDVWYSTHEVAKKAVISEPNTYLYGHDSAAKTNPSLIALRMYDSTPVTGGLGFQKNSELREIMMYQLLKLTENGIGKRIDRIWPDTSRNDDFGMAEPATLGFSNVLFPFTLLATGIVTAMVFAMLEYAVWRS